MFFWYNNSMKFEFDPDKSEKNKAKHGIALSEAQRLWQVPAVELKAKTIGESRLMIIGKLGSKIYSCIYTVRGQAIRLISARRSRKSEEKIYYECIKGKDN